MPVASPTQTNELLVTLLEQAQRARQQEAAAQAARMEAGKQAIQDAIAEVLGPDLWDTLAPYASVQYRARRGGVEARYAFRLPDDLRLAEMHLMAQAHLESDVWKIGRMYWAYENGAHRYPLEKTDQALLDARQRWEAADYEWRKSRAQKEISRLRRYDHPKTEAEALALVALATDICPENAEEWQEDLQAWRELHARDLAQERDARKKEILGQVRQATRDEDEKRLEHLIATGREAFPEDSQWDACLAQGREVIAARRAYRQALETWAQRYTATLRRNRAKAADLLVELAAPVPAWELTYGLCAEDEEGERWVDTRTVTVLNEHPDENGYWRVVRWGVRKVRYLHPVSVTPQTIHPVRETFVPELDRDIEYPPTLTAEAVRERIDTLGLEHLPDLPSVPETLTKEEARNILQNVAEKYADVALDYHLSRPGHHRCC